MMKMFPLAKLRIITSMLSVHSNILLVVYKILLTKKYLLCSRRRYFFLTSIFNISFSGLYNFYQ